MHHPKYNGSPGQEHWVICQNPETGQRTLDQLWWGLVPYWCKDIGGGRKPINANAETVASLPTFRDAYRRRRSLLPVDNFFEWNAVEGARAKQPFAIAMKSGEPFALVRSPLLGELATAQHSEESIRTFVITTAANALVKNIHPRMPVIIPLASCDRWLSSIEPAPPDLYAFLQSQ